MGSESKGGIDVLQIDETYEFCAPQFFDFMNDESEEEIRTAELWFEISQNAGLAFLPKIKEGRSIQIDSLCDFGNVKQTHKEQEQGPAQSNNERDDTTTAAEKARGAQDLIAAAGQQQEMKEGKMSFVFVPDVKPCDTNLPINEDESATTYTRSKEIAFAFPIQPSTNMVPAQALGSSVIDVESRTLKFPSVKGKGRGHSSSKKLGPPEDCTPRAQRVSPKGLAAPNTSSYYLAVHHCMLF